MRALANSTLLLALILVFSTYVVSQQANNITARQSRDPTGSKRLKRAIFSWDVGTEHPPEWLGAVWDIDRGLPGGLYDGKFAGNAIHLGGGYLLSHEQTADAYGRTQEWDGLLSLVFTREGFPPPHHEVPLKSKINVALGNNRRQFKSLNDDTQWVQSSLAGTPFFLHRLQQTSRYKKQRAALINSVIPKLSTPLLETDANSSDTDCRAYAWSRTPATMRGEGEDLYDRYLVALNVTKLSCDGAHCRLSSDNGRLGDGKICTGLTDHGSPVLCGAEWSEKLTYLIEGIQSDTYNCSYEFSAYRVAHMVDDMKKKGNWPYKGSSE